jgi:biopolymer transport protein ExbD
MLFKKKKKGFVKHGQLNEDMNLQITSMADIFIILLVFLLKGYATGTVNITPTKGMKLPMAQASDSQIEALKVEVSETGVQVEGESVMALTNFRFEARDIETSGVSRTLSKALEKQRKKQLMIAKSNTDVKVDSKVVVIADQRVPYTTLKSVLASAAVQGYTDFKLAVVRGE